MPDATFSCPDLTTFTGLDDLGLEVTGQLLESDRAVLACRVLEADGLVPSVWLPGRASGHGGPPVGARAVRVETHDTAGHRPPLPVYRVRSCVAAGHQQGSRAAGEGLSGRPGLGPGWDRGPAPDRGSGRRGLGGDEHCWRHTRKGDKFVTVIIDLTPVRDQTGPARLLDMVEGRSKKAFKDWLGQQDQAFRDGIEVVAMDGFTGFKSATTEELPEAVTVMDPFHVVRLAGEALDECRRRVQQHIHGHRGRKGDPLYTAWRTLATGADLLTENDAHTEVELTWGAYQAMIAAYREPDRSQARTLMQKVIDSLSTAVPAPLVELTKLGRTLARRADDVLAYFDRPHTSNGPTEALNGRLEHLRGSALGFRNLTNYIARALLETGGFRPQLHPDL